MTIDYKNETWVALGDSITEGATYDLWISQSIKAAGKTPLVLSAHSRQGVQEALRALLDIIDDARKKAGEQPDAVAAGQR